MGEEKMELRRRFERRRLLVGTLSVCAALVCGLLCVTSPSRAQSADPAVQISTFYATLLATMKQAHQLGVRGRYDRLAPVIGQTFDVVGMMRVATGTGWDSATPVQQTALIEAFSRMMTATYASRFDGFSGEIFEVSPAVDLPQSGKLVRTRLVQGNGKVVNLNYLMRMTPNGWRIADIYLDGTISELAARRAEFSNIMKSGGPDALANSLRQKADKLLSGT
jgi:phospholipid transport system substrate-binding protein